MNTRTYFQSLGEEVSSLKQRVRYMLDDVHWQTDGEWKESVVRQILRRNLPASAVVSRGFVITAQKATTQLDVLIHDGSKPVVFRDGDLVFVTPDAVLGIIEVKSSVGPSRFEEAADKLGRNIEMIRLHANIRAFSGLFAFESQTMDSKLYLDRLAAVAPTWNHRLDFAALGDSLFIRYWNLDPETQSQMYQRWHSYDLPGLAAGYFVHNVIDSISPESVLRNNDVWFPSDGKEPNRIGTQPGSWVIQNPPYNRVTRKRGTSRRKRP